MKNWRHSTQFLFNGKKDNKKENGYDIYPTHIIESGHIQNTFDSLAQQIKHQKTVVIDAYVGVFLDHFQEQLNTALLKIGINALWWHSDVALKSEKDINTMVEPFLGGNDPVFGKITPLSMADFFDSEKLKSIRPDTKAQMNILIGFGAALAGWEAKLVYIDLPKNELQFRARAKSIFNFGASVHFNNKQTYKRFYFVDWVVFNKHKQSLLPNIDIFVDGQNPEIPNWMKGDELRKSLYSLSVSAFRVRPWFEPGVWGGNWIKRHISGLNKNVPNYAWSFELIVPENGILFQSGERVLEVSFDCLMFQENKNILGKHAQQYAYEFPIRFDFLDTFDGGNLSVQCHPRLEYMQKEFGENITQEECYYILDCKENPKVYLGFQENINPSAFEKDLKQSAKTGKEIDITKHVKSIDSKKHDFFLIPPGTIHGSGKNNLVLEISSTPYIYTFKMYDWARLDLDGNPRPLNIKRGMENLHFERCGDNVETELISKPVLLEKGNDWEKYHLPTHSEHSYDVYRYHFKSKINISTLNMCQVLSLVEGTSVDVTTEQGVANNFNYAETFIIPASVNNYKIQNKGNKKAILVMAFLK